jgi:hypothetical protein
MSVKSIKIGFYVGFVQDSGDVISEVLGGLATSQDYPHTGDGDVQYQIRALHQFHGGASFKGVFAKLRQSDIPHIGDLDGSEREIGIQEDEGVLEKNYFLYFRKNRLLVYQSNFSGSAITAFEKYFSERLNIKTSFNPIVRVDAISRLFNENCKPTRIEFTIAKPTNATLYNSNDFSKNLISLMNETGGSTLGLTISAGGRGKSKKSLFSNATQLVRQLVMKGDVTAAKIKLDGIEHPVDLIADRLVTTRKVKMVGRYPDKDEMYAALLDAKDKFEAELSEYFGTIDAD